MKKLSIVLVLAMLMVSAVPASAAEWSFSGWGQTENSYGDAGLTADDIHEYELQVRLTASAQVNDKTSFVYQIRTLGYYDNSGWNSQTNGDNVRTRLAYVTTNPTDNLSITMGKNAYWLAGGLLMDDFIRGIGMNYKFADNLSLFMLAGNYEANPAIQVYAAAMNGNIGGFDLGLTVLGSSDTIQNAAKAKANSTGKPYEDTLIYAVNAGYNVAKNLNLSMAYAINSKSESAWETSDDKNAAYKVQLGYSGIEKAGIYLQYFAQDAYMMWPTETGNHMGWWSDMYDQATGINGFRLIYEQKLTDNVGLTLCYGKYEFNDNVISNESLTKATVGMNISF